MHFSLAVITEAVLIALSLCMDTFIAAFAYGSNRIKIPFVSAQIINIICSGILGVSLVAGTIIKPYLPDSLTTAICFTILFLIGIIKLLDSVTKSIIRKFNGINRQIKFSIFNFRFILSLCADPIDADIDKSKTISPKEAASLAIALSLDGIAMGLGAAIGDINGITLFIISLFINQIAVISGSFIGNRIAKNLPFNISWLSGALLIILAVFKFT